MESDDEQFAKQGGDAIDIGDEFDDSEDEADSIPKDSDNAMRQPMKANIAASSQVAAPKAKAGEVAGQKVEDQPFDLAVDVNDSEEIDSDEEEDEVNVDINAQAQAQKNQQESQQLAQSRQQQSQQEDDEDDEDEKEIPGAYNPNQYANLPVTQDLKEMFEYIQRYKPQKIDLETKIKPFIPDYIPAVGEVDAFLKMPKPDGQKEDLGISVLDEPCLNHEDKTVLELKYVQSKNVARAAPMTVDSIDTADKKPREVSRWISSVQDLHKTRPPPTVNYTKNMPDIESLMQEWPPEMEQAFKSTTFPGPEIDMHVTDYAKIICAMSDIPVHKLQNEKPVVESLHVLFTLFSEFRSNQHFQQQNNDDAGEGAGTGLIAGYQGADPDLKNF